MKTSAVFPSGVVLLGFLKFPFLTFLVFPNILTPLWKIGGPMRALDHSGDSTQHRCPEDRRRVRASL